MGTPPMLSTVGAETLRRIATMPRFNRWLAELMGRYVADKRVVEVGCGIGTLTELLAPSARAVLCLDLDPAYVELVRSQYERDAKVRVIQADAADTSWVAPEVGRWDVVVCCNVLEHIADDRQALATMNSALVAGGHLILYVPALPWLYGSLDLHLGHYRRYDRSRLVAQLREAGFDVIESRWVNLFGIAGWFLNGKILRRTVLPARQLRVYDRFCRVFRALEEPIGPPIGQSLFVVSVKRAAEANRR